MTPDLKDRIAGVLAFFQIWKFPLRKEEIESFLGEKISSEFLREHFYVIREKNAEYFSIVHAFSSLPRYEREIYSQKLQKKAAKYVRILRHFPFIRGIALTNTPAMNVAGKESDIDLFLITKTGRIWTARFFSTLFFSILGLRAEKQNTHGKFCLSFFVDEEYIDLEPLKNRKDVYLAFWSVTMRPFFGEEYFQKFREKNASWIKKEAGLIFPPEQEKMPAGKSVIQKFLEFFLPSFFENIFKTLLLKKAIKFRNPSSLLYNPDMIFDDRIQKLHNPDMRKQIQKHWEENLLRFEKNQKEETS